MNTTFEGSAEYLITEFLKYYICEDCVLSGGQVL